MAGKAPLGTPQAANPIGNLEDDHKVPSRLGRFNIPALPVSAPTAPPLPSRVLASLSPCPLPTFSVP